MEAAYYPVILLETRLRFQALACCLSFYPGCVLQLQIEVCFQGLEMLVVARIRVRTDGRLLNLRVGYVLGQRLLFVYTDIDSRCLGPEMKRVFVLSWKLLWALLRLAQVLVACRVEARSWNYRLRVALQQARRYELVLVDDLNLALYILLAVTV